MDIVIRAFFAFVFVARLQQIPSLAEVRWAVLETSGKISFIPHGRG